MATREPPSRERQIAHMDGAEERATKAARRWIANPEFRAALHRHDFEHDGNHRTVKVKRTACS